MKERMKALCQLKKAANDRGYYMVYSRHYRHYEIYRKDLFGEAGYLAPSSIGKFDVDMLIRRYMPT